MFFLRLRGLSINRINCKDNIIKLMSTLSVYDAFDGRTSVDSSSGVQGFITSYVARGENKPSGSVCSETEIDISSELLKDNIKREIVKRLTGSRVGGSCLERRVFCDVDGQLPHQLALFCHDEKNDKLGEITRNGISQCARSLSGRGVTSFLLDSFKHIQAAAEGVVLSTYSYLKFKKKSENRFGFLANEEPVDDDKIGRFNLGLVLGSSQNIARYLSDSPANKCTPSNFVGFVFDFYDKIVRNRICNKQSFSIDAKDLGWIKEQKMGAFLSVTNGSEEPPKFLIIKYNGYIENGIESDEKPIVLVGKGVTFDSGGISLKPPANMSAMKADMQGASVVTVATLTAAYMRLPVNLVCLVPLTENLPSGTATKPGDVVVASNGKTIEIDNTDAEGRLILSDALCHAQEYEPSVLIDVATLTGAIDVALGYPYSAIFSTSERLCEEMESAGRHSDDKLWRMPLDEYYTDMIESSVADIINAAGRSGGSCTAAAFLKQFVGKDQIWAHLDIAGSMLDKDGKGVLPKGMTGRPIRTLMYWLLEKSKMNISQSQEESQKQHFCRLPGEDIKKLLEYMVPF